MIHDGLLVRLTQVPGARTVGARQRDISTPRVLLF